MLPGQHYPPSFRRSTLLFLWESPLSYYPISCGSGRVDFTAQPEGRDWHLTNISFSCPWWSIQSCWPLGINSETLVGICLKLFLLPVGDMCQELQAAIISYLGRAGLKITSLRKKAERVRESLGDRVGLLDTAVFDGRSSPELPSNMKLLLLKPWCWWVLQSLFHIFMFSPVNWDSVAYNQKNSD